MGNVARDLSGQRFGRLIAERRVVASDPRYRRYVVFWCVCDCGAACEVPSGSLTGGRTQSCGCIAREKLAARNAVAIEAAKRKREAKLAAIRASVESPFLTYETPRGESVCGVYIIRNLVDGKVYIGSSKMIDVRWKNHVHELRKGKHHNKYLQRAWNKHGEDAFTFDMLEECSEDALVFRERCWLEHVKPFDDRGYNSYDAPTFGHYLRTAATREKHRQIMLARPKKPPKPKPPKPPRVRQEHCKRGHSLSDAYIIHSEGRVRRHCRTCASAWKKAYRADPGVKAREKAYMDKWRANAKRRSRPSAQPDPKQCDTACKAT